MRRGGHRRGLRTIDATIVARVLALAVARQTTAPATPKMGGGKMLKPISRPSSPATPLKAPSRIVLDAVPSEMERAIASRQARAAPAPVLGWMERDVVATRDAIAYLRSLGLLVQKISRDAAVPRYRMTGIQQSLSGAQIRAFAIRRGASL